MGAPAAIWIIAIAATLFLLRAASQLLIPIVLAVLISYALEPVVAWLHRRHVPRMAGAGFLLALILGLSVWGGFSLRDDAVDAMEALPQVARRARDLVLSEGASGVGSPVREAIGELRQGSNATGSAQAQPQKADSGSQDEDAAVNGGSDQSTGAGGQPPVAQSTISQWIQRGVGSVLALAGHMTVIVFLVFFLLTSGSHFRKRLIEISGPERRRTTATIIDDINAQIQRFLLVRAITGVVVAAATWAVLAWMQVPQAAVWGILAGVFNSIPYFGPIIVSGGLLLIGLVQEGDPMYAFKISAAALVITSLEGWLLTPPLLGKTERMHVVVVFLGVLLWTWIWGAWGTILAVPMLVILKAVADHSDRLKPVSRLMAP